MYTLELRESIEKKFLKLRKRNPKQLEIIWKKIEEILQNPNHYKNLRSPLQHLKRIHIDKSFVLVFSVNETTKTVTIEDYDHHDKIYVIWFLRTREP
ncbi:MAG: hypothetical protein QXT19_03465 [Candidatus Woesearchaeota archaeon]